MEPLTEEEIRIEKILDQMDLERLEDSRQIYDMEAWGSGAGKQHNWTFRRPTKSLTRRSQNDTVVLPLEEA